MTLEERFWPKVRKTDTCWLWTAAKTGFGYGKLGFRSGGKQITRDAHRLSWEMHNGTIPDGKRVLHRCDVPACVRPDHLFLGTQKDNIRDMHAKGRFIVGDRSWVRPSGDAHWMKQPENAERARKALAKTHASIRGELNSLARLTAEGVREIRAQTAAGRATRALALKFKVTPTTIRRVVRREAWAHIP